MRLIGFSLLTFLIASVALLISDRGFLERKMSQVASYLENPIMGFEPTNGLAKTAAAENVRFSAHGRGPIILSGLPSHQSITFTLPKDSRIRSGHLQIGATTQVLEGAQAVLRVQVNGSRRAEVLLFPSQHHRIIRIPLMPEDLAALEVSVSFSLRGDGTTNGCTSVENTEVVVEIERSSALYLALDASSPTPRDQIAAWGQHVYATWPSRTDGRNRIRSVLAATSLAQRGYGVDFVPVQTIGGSFNHEELEKFQSTTRDEIVSAPDRNNFFPRYFAKQNANAGTRRFNLATDWRLRYRLQDIAEGVFPDALKLSLSLGGARAGTDWTIYATLNGHLLAVGQVDASQYRHQASILLPAKYHRPSNVLQVSVVSNYSSDSRCDAGPELIAEMHMDTHLTSGQVQITNPLKDVQKLLHTLNEPRLLGLGRLSPLEATKAVHLLAAVMPNEPLYAAVEPQGQIHVLRRDDLMKRHRSQGWLVYQNGPTDDVMALPVGAKPHELAAIESSIVLHIRPTDGGEL